MYLNQSDDTISETRMDLTLTRVVFESIFLAFIRDNNIYLTLTRVVFEFSKAIIIF